MAAVTEGFSYKDGMLVSRKDRRKEWNNLAGLMQPRAEERLRISYYHDVAVGWMQNPAVDVLGHAELGVPRFAQRVDSREEENKRKGAISWF